MVFGRRPQNPFMNPPSAEAFNPYMESQGEEEIPEVKTKDMDNDPCCEEARMKFREALRKHFGRSSWGDIDSIIEGSCEELQRELESWISQNWNREEDKDKHGITLHEDLLRIQNEWDACSSESFEGVFTASSDPFEMAWGMMVKGEFRGYSPNRNISERPYRQAKAKTWQQSKKVQRGRTQKRYQRNKTRGNIRPQQRRQLGAGGRRFSTKR